MTTTSTSTVVPPPYSSSSSLDEYLSSISPPRELICPITQELYRDPVLACDGHTYERKSLTTWFGTGNIRSPVTNSILDSSFGDGDGDDGGGGATNSFGERRGNGMRGRRNENFMVSNLAVSSMANAHRERLGRELVRLCARDGRRYHDRGALIGGNKSHDEDEEDATMVGGGGGGGDGDRMAGAMIEGLLDAGADPDGRDETSNTPLHLVRKRVSPALLASAPIVSFVFRRRRRDRSDPIPSLLGLFFIHDATLAPSILPLSLSPTADTMWEYPTRVSPTRSRRERHPDQRRRYGLHRHGRGGACDAQTHTTAASMSIVVRGCGRSSGGRNDDVRRRHRRVGMDRLRG